MITRKRFREEVRNIVKQLIKLYHPEKIILFGSLMEKDKSPRDIDLFIIKKDPPYLGIDRIRELSSPLAHALWQRDCCQCDDIC